MIKINLPIWMRKGEPLTLARISKLWWEKIYQWIQYPLEQRDIDTCDETILSLLAYQRDIERFENEPLNLFRLRVKYAFINARDSGSIAGFIAIFERLGIGYVELLERQPDIDWDVIIVRVTDSQISGNSELLMSIIRQYGRTCRRYQYEVITSTGLYIRAGWVGCDYVCYSASLDS